MPTAHCTHLLVGIQARLHLLLRLREHLRRREILDDDAAVPFDGADEVLPRSRVGDALDGGGSRGGHCRFKRLK